MQAVGRVDSSSHSTHRFRRARSCGPTCEPCVAVWRIAEARAAASWSVSHSAPRDRSEKARLQPQGSHKCSSTGPSCSPTLASLTHGYQSPLDCRPWYDPYGRLPVQSNLQHAEKETLQGAQCFHGRRKNGGTGIPDCRNRVKGRQTRCRQG